MSEFEKCSWFDHEPIVGEILQFLPPSNIFFETSWVCKSWKEYIESEQFAKVYFRKVVCNGTEGEIFHVNLPETITVKKSSKSSLFDPLDTLDSFLNDSTTQISTNKHLNSIFESLEKTASLKVKSMSWKEQFYLKMLSCVGCANRRIKEKVIALPDLSDLEDELENIFPSSVPIKTASVTVTSEKSDPLIFLKECLTTSQLEFMKTKFTEWGLRNMLKSDLIVDLVNSRFIMFKDDGTPFTFNSKGFNDEEILSYTKKTIFDDDKYQPGIQTHVLSKLIEPNEPNTIQLNQQELAMWEDYITCVHPTYRHRRVNQIQPFERVIQTRYMSDYQHVELSQRAEKNYHNNVYLKWRPHITWHNN